MEKKLKIKQGQAFLEFTFAIIVLLIMIYGVIRVFCWTGVDLAKGRLENDRILLDPVKTSAQQIDPHFYTPQGFNAIWTEFSR